MNAKNILVIDDSVPLLKLYKDILTSYGYVVTTRSTGKGALDFVSSIRPNLIILDMMLDGYDGRDICNTLEQSHSVKDIPVVIVSATYLLERRISGRCKPDNFLEKPFEIDDLGTMIESELKKAG
ncbi:MAG: response regulator [Sphingobacteriaceae bacterium]|nr:MAG: response regulator [Sphingobacteriaceae bacterium]